MISWAKRARIEEPRGVAIVSKNIAEQIRFMPSDDCFLAGLLHDIGKVVLSQYFQDIFKRIWAASSSGSMSFAEAEKSELSIDHAVIGGYLAERWQLPAPLGGVERRLPRRRARPFAVVRCGGDRGVEPRRTESA